MARRGVSLNPGYRSGSHWAICDSCGFQFRAGELKETWDNRWVCDDDFEVRHPQDFLRVKAEKIYVDEPIRPENLGDADLNSYGNRAVADQARAGAAVAGLVYQNLDESNARTSIAQWATAGFAIAGLQNREENLSEIIPQSTFNLETL